MTSRLNQLNTHFSGSTSSFAKVTKKKKPQPVLDVWKSLDIDLGLRPEVKELRKTLRSWFKTNQAKLDESWLKSEFPFWALDDLRKMNLFRLSISEKFGGLGWTNMET